MAPGKGMEDKDNPSITTGAIIKRVRGGEGDSEGSCDSNSLVSCARAQGMRTGGRLGR